MSNLGFEFDHRWQDFDTRPDGSIADPGWLATAEVRDAQLEDYLSLQASATSAGLAALDTRVDVLEAVNSDARLDALEALRAYVICTSATRPTGTEGVHIYETDTNRRLVHDGTNWIILSEPVQSVASPAADWANVTAGSGQFLTTYRRSHGFIDVRTSIVFGTSTAFAGAVSMTLPVAASSDHEVFSLSGMARDASTGVFCPLVVRVNGATLTPYPLSSATQMNNGGVTSTVPFTWTNGPPPDQLQINARYRMTTVYS